MSSALEILQTNAQALANANKALLELILARTAIALSPSPNPGPLPVRIPLTVPAAGSAFAQVLEAVDGNAEDLLLIALAVAPHFAPASLEGMRSTFADGSPIVDWGTYKGPVHKGLIPTWQTALFLLAGNDFLERNRIDTRFDSNHPLFRQGLLRLDQLHPQEPPSTALLLPSRELISLLSTGLKGEPEFGPSFPAQRIETNRQWEDLILHEDTMREIQDIRNWIEHEHTVMTQWKLASRLAPGYRCLFHGPPGTGKTFTATLLGQATGKEVYRIDLSMVVSKYIGETEKNLKAVFDKAESRGWILFFDEADALFGKRTDVSDSKDRYANQEVSYLLQRVEQFDGVVILATNNRDNMDRAFTRRFQVVVNFTMPSAQERYKIWEAGLPADCPLAPGTDLAAIAERYELAGGSIMNIIRFSALRAAVRGTAEIHAHDILDGIRTEFRKAGRILN